MKHIIKGVIKDTTQVQQFKKKNGETNVKCVLHIVAPGDDPHPEELAVTVCGNLTLYSKVVGSQVEVEYVVRVFPFEKNGMTMYGNDIYASLRANHGDFMLRVEPTKGPVTLLPAVEVPPIPTDLVCLEDYILHTL